MNRQEVFEIVWAHAAHMTAKAYRDADTSSCGYRTPDGNKCFVGVLIKDELYDSALEGENPLHPSVVTALRLSGVDVNTVLGDDEFLTGLQSVHDDNPMELWDSGLRNFAQEYGLVAPSTLLRSIQ